MFIVINKKSKDVEVYVTLTFLSESKDISYHKLVYHFVRSKKTEWSTPSYRIVKKKALKKSLETQEDISFRKYNAQTD